MTGELSNTDARLATLYQLLNVSTEYKHDAAEIVKVMDAIKERVPDVDKIIKRSSIDVTVNGEIVFTSIKGSISE